MISNWAQRDWDAFVAACAGQDRAVEREALQRFLVGVSYRREEIQAHELTGLLERTQLADEARAELVDDIQFALGLLAAYDRLLGDGGEDEDDLSAYEATSGEPGIGDLVI